MTTQPQGKGRGQGGVLGVVTVVALLLVGVPLLLRAMVSQYQQGPIRAQLKREAGAVQRAALATRSDPASTGPAAERALADALGARPRIRVLRTWTATDGTVRADVSLWTGIDTGGFTFSSPTTAVACLRVVVSPGMASGGYGQRGAIDVDGVDCPRPVALAPDDITHQPAPPRLPQIRLHALPSVLVPPDSEPCYSGSGTCN